MEILPRTGESLTFWDTKQTFGYMNPRIMNPSANDSSFCQNHSAFSLGIPLLQPTASGEGFLSFRLNDSGFRGIICFRIHDSGIHITLGLFGIPSGKGFTSPRQISTWDLLSPLFCHPGVASDNVLISFCIFQLLHLYSAEK